MLSARVGDGSARSRTRRAGSRDLAVQTPVVEPVDVLDDGDLKVVDVLPRPLVADQLGLEQRDEGLGQRVVV
jgi:hypothetical protein